MKKTLEHSSQLVLNGPDLLGRRNVEEPLDTLQKIILLYFLNNGESARLRNIGSFIIDDFDDFEGPLSQVGSRRKLCPGQFGQDGMGLIPVNPSTKHAQHEACFVLSTKQYACLY